MTVFSAPTRPTLTVCPSMPPVSAAALTGKAGAHLLRSHRTWVVAYARAVTLVCPTARGSRLRAASDPATARRARHSLVRARADP